MAHSRGRPRGCSLTTTVRTDRDQRARRTLRAMFERSASTLAFDRAERKARPTGVLAHVAKACGNWEHTLHTEHCGQSLGR